MIRLIYNFIIWLVEKLIPIIGLFNPKINLGIVGRRNSFSILQEKIKPSDKVIWMHVASLGEFEQGRPVLEGLKSDYPNHLILLSFFSPSGYEIRKDYEHADVICYLPLDMKANARRFLELAHPELVIFVKYEFWPNYLNEIAYSSAKSILISTVVQSDNRLMSYQRSWFVDMLSVFDHILTQDEDSLQLLKSIDVQSEIAVTGDTRIDRTLQIAKSAKPIPEIESFVAGHKVLVAGSTWNTDEDHLLRLFDTDDFKGWKLIIAPHDVSQSHIQSIERKYEEAIRYSALEPSRSCVLIIDNIGLLNQLYQYADLAYIGGGFGAGIHNTLEPAAFGIPIIFGPKYQKFVEAVSLVNNGGGFTYNSSDELIQTFQKLNGAQLYEFATGSVESFMESNRGATEKVMEAIEVMIDN